MKEQITPCLWFDPAVAGAKAAADLYCTHLSEVKVLARSPMVTELEIAGQRFTLLDGGPKYKPNASISFFYICETEDEINRIWKAFSEKGSVIMPLDKYDWSKKYGWINDAFGVSWQFALGNIKEVGQKITPSLLFSGKQYGRAEEAIRHYSAIFKNVKTEGVLHFGANEAPEKEGKVKHAQVALNGQKFMFMDSALPHDFTFSEGVSLTVHCETQDEIDHYWNKLTEGGKESMCGWLKDKFGVWWQIIPNVLNQIMSDPEKAGKAAKAFMEMRKLDIEQIIRATLK
jgi:predicted 3-demethylubiquinone-9 3-methyltransferase (glyoxalase superfamily)